MGIYDTGGGAGGGVYDSPLSSNVSAPSQSWWQKAGNVVGNVAGDVGKSVKGLAGGIGNFFGEPLGQGLTSAGEELASGIERVHGLWDPTAAARARQYQHMAGQAGMWALQSTASMAPGLAQIYGNLASDASKIGGQYNPMNAASQALTGQSFAKDWVAAQQDIGNIANVGGSPIFNPAMMASLKGAKDTSFAERAKTGGWLGTAYMDALPITEAGGVGEKFSAHAADAAEATKLKALDAAKPVENAPGSMSPENPVPAGSFGNPEAEAAAAEQAKWARREKIASYVHHPLKQFIGIKGADFIRDFRETVQPGAGAAANAKITGVAPEAVPAPGDVAAATQGLADIAQSAPDAALNPTREVLGQAAAEADAATVAAARLNMDPGTATAETLSGAARAAADAADAERAKLAEPTKPARDAVKIPERPGNTPSGNEDVAAGIDAKVQAARDAVDPTHVEENLPSRLQPVPADAWAVRLAERIPGGPDGLLSRALAHLDVPLEKARIMRLDRDLRRRVDIAQNVEKSSEAMQTARAQIAAPIMATDPTIDRPRASRMAGEAIARIHDGTSLVDQFVRRFGGIPDALRADLIDRANRHYKGIPEDVLAKMTPEVRAQVEASVGTAAEQFKERAAQRLQTLLASRQGAQGLEASLLPPDSAMPLTKELQGMYERALADYRRAAWWKERIPQQEARRQRELDKLVLKSSTLDASVIEAQRRLGVTEETVQTLHDGIVPGLADPEGTANAAITDAGLNEQNNGFFGTTIDVATQKPVDLTGRIVTGIGGRDGQFVMTRTEFNTQAGQAAVVEAIRFPKAPDGTTVYDAAALWSGPDAKLGIWESPATPEIAAAHGVNVGEPMVYGDISISTNHGVPLTERQATFIGEAYSQQALWDQRTFEEIPLSGDPNKAALYGHYIEQVLDPTSHLNRAFDQQEAVVNNEGVKMTQKEVQQEMLFKMQVDQGLHALHPDTWPLGHYFAQGEHAFATREPRGPFLPQTVMELTTHDLIQSAFNSMDAAKISKALSWYYDSHDFVEGLYRGKTWPVVDEKTGVARDAADVFYDTVAVASVMANPLQNFGRALMAFANFDDFLKAQEVAHESVKALFERVYRDEPAASTHVENLGSPIDPKTGKVLSERDLGPESKSGSSIAYRWLNTPEFRKLTESTAMTTTPKYNIIDVLTGRLNLETATAADIAGQYADWTGKERASSEANFPRANVGQMADTLGLQGPGVEAYKAWSERRAALAELRSHIEIMRDAGYATKENIVAMLDTQGLTTQAELKRAWTAYNAQEATLRADPAVEQAFQQAIMEYHGSGQLAKLRSFSDNLRNPATSMAVTLDSVMAAAFGMDKTAFGLKGVYDAKANEVRDEANYQSQPGSNLARPTMPHEIQALGWVAAKYLIGKQDWGRLLAHHDIAQGAIDAFEKAAAEGQPLDASTFQPFRAWWDEEIGDSTQAESIRKERVDLQRRSKSRYFSPEEAARLAELQKWVPGTESTVWVAPERASVSDYTDSNPERETRKQFPDDTKVLKKKTASYGLYITKEKAWQADIAAGNFEKVRAEMQGYTEGWERPIKGDADGGSFAEKGPETANEPGSSANTAAGRLQGAQYVPQPNGDVLHGTINELHEQINGALRGATVVDPNQAGRLLVKLYAGADIGTLTHEDMHLLRLIATGPELEVFKQAYPGIEGRMPSGTLNVQRLAAEERFVNDFMGWLHKSVKTGTAPSMHAELFTKIASLMEEQYPHFLATQAGRVIPQDIVAFWDRTFNPEIVKPDVLHDPLSDQYVKPPTGVNTRKFRWESDHAYAERTRQYGEGRATAVTQERELAQAQRRAAIADAQVLKMKELLAQPTHAEKMATTLTAKADATLANINVKLGDPDLAHTPPAFRNILQAFQEVADGAKADKTGATAQMLSEIPTTFAQVLKYLGEMGFEPTHVPDMTWQMAQKYLYGHMSLLDGENKDGTRAENQGVLWSNNAAERSLEMFGAANVRAMRELYRGKLIDFIETNYSQVLSRGQDLPKGWKFWDPEKQAIVLGRHSDTTGGVFTMGDRRIVPEGVSTALDSMRQPYVNWTWRPLVKATGVWKMALLAMSPAWYVMHFVGALSTAALEGARPTDFMKAFGQWRRDELPAFVRGRDVWITGDNAVETSIVDPTRDRRVGTVINAKTSDLAQVARNEGLKVALREASSKMYNVVKTVDGIARAAVYAMHIRKGASIEYAITRGYESLGDFTNLAPIERTLALQIMPFYAFKKAMFKLLLRLPIDHPLATAVALQLNYVNKQDLQRQLGTGLYPDYLIGKAFNPDGTILNFGKANPLTESYKLATLEGLKDQISPFFKPLVAAGYDAQTFNGSAGVGAYGQLVSKPNILKDYIQAFTESPIGSLNTPGAGQSQIDSLINFIDPARTMTKKQVDALIKRLAKTTKGIQTANQQGGYLQLVGNPPTGSSSGSGAGVYGNG